jgi:hypothetical protein
MQLFEITLLLLAIAVVLLQAARRLRVPYPAMLDAALEELGRFSGATADAVRGEYAAARAAGPDPSRAATEYDNLRVLAVAAERRVLIDWRQKGRIYDDAYHLLEEELDRAELHAAAAGAAPLEASPSYPADMPIEPSGVGSLFPSSYCGDRAPHAANGSG